MDKKFAVKLTLGIAETTDPNNVKQFFDAVFSYYEMPIAGVLAIETLLGQVGEVLLKLGYEAAKDDPQVQALQKLLESLKK
jgi:hypothetical protein